MCCCTIVLKEVEKMKIKEMLTQNRRDFRAIMICEHCGTTEKLMSGYDDAYYHASVIPAMKCKKCGKCSPSTYVPNNTLYPEGLQV